MLLFFLLLRDGECAKRGSFRVEPVRFLGLTRNVKSRKGSKSHKVTGRILVGFLPVALIFHETFSGFGVYLYYKHDTTVSASYFVLRTVKMFSLQIIYKVKSHVSATRQRFCFVFFFHYLLSIIQIFAESHFVPNTELGMYTNE